MVSRAVPTANDGPAADDLAEYPDSLDAGLLRIAGVCILASVMAILDGTVVSVAQRTFIAEFASTQAVVAWTITGYTLGQATVIPLAGWASDRFGTKRFSWARLYGSPWHRCCARWHQTLPSSSHFESSKVLAAGCWCR